MSATMSASVTSDTTLLTEHLTYRPAALIDDIINSINILAFKATDAVEKGLLSASPSSLGFKQAPSTSDATADPSEAAKDEIENGVHQLETLLEAKIDKNFDKLEVYALRNILSVPPDVRDHVRLSHYEGLDFSAVRDGDAPSLESVSLQRRKLKETMKLRALLDEETKRNEGFIIGLRDLLGVPPHQTLVKDEEGKEKREITQPPVFAFLQNGMSSVSGGSSNQPLETTTSFALSQLPALRSFMQDLKPRLEQLASGSDGSDGLVGEEEKSWRRQRLEFVEKEARRHLESVRGLELGEMGEVRDGEWQGEGEKIRDGRGSGSRGRGGVATQRGRREYGRRGVEGDGMIKGFAWIGVPALRGLWTSKRSDLGLREA